jgi:hypothetical protein
MSSFDFSLKIYRHDGAEMHGGLDPALIRSLLARLGYNFNGIDEWIVDDG